MSTATLPLNLRVPILPSAERPTLEGLLNHAQKFHLDARDRKGNPIEYRGYPQLRKDPLVEVGRAYLGRQSYGLLIEGLGYGHLYEEAAADWDDERGEEE